MPDSIFTQIRMQRGDQEKSSRWYRSNASKLASGMTGQQILQGQKLSNVVTPGYMYMFLYDPKYKDVLPYYDTVPLVFPFNRTADGFVGINIHYLPYGARYKLLSDLRTLVTDKKMNEFTKVKISWQILNSSSKYLAATHCVKRYLNSHLKSRFLKISIEDWETAAMLPVEGFKKKSKNRVWKDVKGKRGRL